MANALHCSVTYGEATYRVFGPAACVKDSGWTGVSAPEKPPGEATPADGQIVKFAGKKAVLNTQCVNGN